MSTDATLNQSEPNVILTAHVTKVNRTEPNWTEPQTCLACRNHALTRWISLRPKSKRSEVASENSSTDRRSRMFFDDVKIFIDASTTRELQRCRRKNFNEFDAIDNAKQCRKTELKPYCVVFYKAVIDLTAFMREVSCFWQLTLLLGLLSTVRQYDMRGNETSFASSIRTVYAAYVRDLAKNSNLVCLLPFCYITISKQWTLPYHVYAQCKLMQIGLL